ncbi:MAG: sigma 54-interacting transcriptional regulator [Firmicutes bacterium]|nr:sigma 54-interacting transcriptional regulator [Bacillota bacterium]
MHIQNDLKKYTDDYVYLLEKIIDELPLPISVVGNDEKFAMINSRYEKAFGKPRKSILGKHFTVNLKSDEISVHKPVLETGTPYRKAKRMGEPEHTVLVEGIPINIDGKTVCSVGVIHEYNRVEKIMSELERKQETLTAFKSERARFTFDDIVGQSKVQKNTIRIAKLAAETDVTVLLRGETGTGKELFAHAIQCSGTRANKPFLRINCAAIPESLLESILFGYEANAFTGAKKGGEIGLFEAADKGTIFLDEIGDLSPMLQSKLLRVLQEGEVVRVGGIKPKIVNVRIIAATNADLEEKVENKEFRRDLYYRLNVFPITVPPLRDRVEDIQELADHFINRCSSKYYKSVRSISPEALRAFESYDWPGNIRELDHVITRAVVGMEADRHELDIEDLDFFTQKLPAFDGTSAAGPGAIPDGSTYRQLFESWESGIFKALYEQCGGNKTEIAAKMCISVRSVYEKLKKYNIC